MANKNTKAIGNLLMGIRFSVLMKLVFTNGLGLKPLYIIRFLILIPTSILAELFVVIENLKSGRRINTAVIDKPPIFIIGHWRSGTTFLHQLIFLDNQFITPTVIQTIIPEHFLFSTRYWLPVLKKMMPPKRPMDEVEMGPLDPMEDEWALLRMGAPTPFIKVFFPSDGSGFAPAPAEFIPNGKKLALWKEKFLMFLTKISLETKKQLVLKNPFHTPRMELIAGIFPGAKFIHIVRHPYKIVPSAINMWNIVSGQNALEGGWKEPDLKETSKVVNDFWQCVNINKANLCKSCFTELRYEDLEKDPVGALRKIYRELDLNFSPVLEERIHLFLEEKKNYRKNRFDLTREQKDSISSVLDGYMKYYGYES